MLLLVHDQELTRKFKIGRGSRCVLDVNQELPENGEQVGVRCVPDGHQPEAGGTTYMQAADDEVAVFDDEEGRRCISALDQLGIRGAIAVRQVEGVFGLVSNCRSR